MIFVPAHFKLGSSAICPSRSMRATSWIAFRPLWIAQRENRRPRLSLPALHQWPPGTRQTPSAGRRQCNSIVSVSQRTRPAAICWLVSVRPGSATEAQCKTVAPAHAALSRHGCRSDAGFGPIRGAEVIELYQGLVRYRASLRRTLRSYNCGVYRPTA